MSEWISVKDRLPEEGQDVIVFSPHGLHQQAVAFLRRDHYFQYHKYNGLDFICEPTHWKPLDDPPESKESDND